MSDLTIGERFLNETTSQDLSAGSLNYTTSVGTDFRLVSIFFRLSGTSNQDITVTLDAASGANYDTVIGYRKTKSNTSFQFVPGADQQEFPGNDEINITMTNTGTPSVTVYVTIMMEQR